MKEKRRQLKTDKYKAWLRETYAGIDATDESIEYLEYRVPRGHAPGDSHEGALWRFDDLAGLKLVKIPDSTPS